MLNGQHGRRIKVTRTASWLSFVILALVTVVEVIVQTRVSVLLISKYRQAG